MIIDCVLSCYDIDVLIPRAVEDEPLQSAARQINLYFELLQGHLWYFMTPLVFLDAWWHCPLSYASMLSLISR
jgi:hypothetical protein